MLALCSADGILAQLSFTAKGGYVRSFSQAAGVRYGSSLCEKSREPRKRRIVFSIAVSRPRLPVQLVSVSMKLRQMFYTQIERRTFHTVWKAGTHNPWR